MTDPIFPPLTIRPAVSGDVRAMGGIFVEAMKRTPARAVAGPDMLRKGMAMVEQSMERSACRHLLAEIDSVPCGFMTYSQTVHPDIFWIDHFYTLQLAPYKIGSTLFKALCLAEPDALEICLSSSFSGKAVYRKLGFTGRERSLSIDATRIRMWRDCANDIFPRFLPDGTRYDVPAFVLTA